MSYLSSIDWFAVFPYIAFLAKSVALLSVVLGIVSYTVYAERRVSAIIQDRLGPNRTGIPLTNIHIQGLGQPIADALKLLLKEDFTPGHVKKFYYWIAPGLGISAVILTLAVVPFGSSLNVDPIIQWFFGMFGFHALKFGDVPMVIANLNVGILFVFAISSLGVYGIVLAGWASNSKYPFLGGIRATSQMISYELALGLSVIPIFMVLGKLNLVEAVQYQVQNGWLLLPITKIELFFKGQIGFSQVLTLKEALLWVPMIISFIVFMISLFAETNRTPFDLPEAETELAGGYNVEYSSMKFALFFLGEYAAMIAGSSIVVTLFLGGWHFPGIPDGSHGLFFGLLNIAVFFLKVIALLLFFIWVRWTLPRFRYDQLMRIGWIYFFEIALVNIFITAGILMYF